MDYSELVRAVLDEDQREVDYHVNALRDVLVSYMRVRLNTTREDAEDSAQNALLKIIERIRNGKINQPDALLAYAFTTARNDYFKKVEKINERLDENIETSATQQADQLDNILDDERKKLLNDCIGELKEEYQDYIRYWFENPDMEADDVAIHFKISVNNAWTRKHRIVKILNDCYKKKFNL